jgi:AraC family transcriptional regulator
MANDTRQCVNDKVFAANGIRVRVSAPCEQEGEGSMHFHDHGNIVFFLAGGCVEKRRHSTCERTVLDVLFLHPGEWHQTILTRHPTRYISLEMETILLNNCGASEADICHTVNKTPDAKFLMLKIYYELLRQDVFSADSIQMLFYQFAAFSKSIPHTKTAPSWIKTVHELLNDRWNETVSLTDLANATGVHPTTVSKYFPLYFASTLGNYMRKLRIAHSLALIKKSAGSLTGIAYDCNFADQSHFIRNFRHFTSFTPKQYQNL